MCKGVVCSAVCSAVQGWLVVVKVREEGLRAWLPLACLHLHVSGVWWSRYGRLKLFQGVLVNYKIAGRDNYLNKMCTNQPVAALYF